MLNKIKFKAFNWIYNRRSADDTTNRGAWVLVGLVLVLLVAAIITVAAKTGFTNLSDLFVKTTEGNQTQAPGQWK